MLLQRCGVMAAESQPFIVCDDNDVDWVDDFEVVQTGFQENSIDMRDA